MKKPTIVPIPLDVAARLCSEIRKETEENWHTTAARWCWYCQQTIEGDMTRPGYLRAPDNRGCALINARYYESLLTS